MRITKRQLRRIIREYALAEQSLPTSPGALMDLGDAASAVNPYSEADELHEDELEEVAPPGWEGTVKKMKGDPDIENPWALAWSMKKKGHKPAGKK
tara:strand:+ start:2646 stop:2933 length:288 start_codon:yes stop_codon:yes gene_type:complete